VSGEPPDTGSDRAGGPGDRDGPGGRHDAEAGRAAPGEPPLPPAPRREPSILRRSPAFAVLALAVSAWLLAELWPDLAYFAAPLEPIDLGGPGAYALEKARPNRLVQVRGDLSEAVPVTLARTGQARTVGRLAGTNLIVDRPGRSGPPVYEGRLLPAGARADYAEAVRVLASRGAPLGEAWLVLRDGERPRQRWWPVLGGAALALLAAVNVRALWKALRS
jgi:hypothetical protein